MGELFERYNAEPVQGNDITIGNDFPEILISDTDQVFCYFGICLTDERYRRSLFMCPYDMQGKHSTDKRVSKEIQGFYRLADGCIVLGRYVDNRPYSARIYKRINALIRFPSPGTYYGVLINHEEDEPLTRALFGLTYRELASLLEAYAKVMGTEPPYPKLTRSISSENYCDLTEALIPAKFPYVALGESGNGFSHVSLWGFYGHVQLLTGCKMESSISQLLLKAGATEEVLQRLFDVGRTIYSQTKVTRKALK